MFHSNKERVLLIVSLLVVATVIAGRTASASAQTTQTVIEEVAQQPATSMVASIGTSEQPMPNMISPGESLAGMPMAAPGSPSMPPMPQMPSGGPGPGPMGPMGPMPGGPGMMMQNMQNMCPMMGGPSAMAVADGYVYVLKGNTLYQFSAKTLKLANKAELPAPTPPAPPAPPQ
jgi:hypothetical protein